MGAAHLWPQHRPQAKDRLENRLHQNVCSRRMRLRRAVRIFELDWRRYI
jgi:hypothetical protein